MSLSYLIMVIGSRAAGSFRGMRRWPSIGFAAFALVAGCYGSPTMATYQGGDYRETIAIGTWDRSFRVHVPTRATIGPVAPLILAFHGVGQNAAQLESQTGLDAAAEAAGAIVVYPESALGSWDISGDFVEIFGINDMQFIRTMIDRLSSEYVIDRDHIIAVGLSNGAVFSQLLGCQMADVITGFVSVAGTLPRPTRDACHPEKPVGALYILGSNDSFFPVEGDDVVLSVDSTLAFWAAEARCSGKGPRITLPDTARDGTIAYRTRYADCGTGGGVTLDSIANSGHGWPGSLRVVAGISKNLSTNQEIIQFLMAGRSRPR